MTADAQQSFTAMLLGRGNLSPALGGSWVWEHYVGVVFANDGDTLYTSGPVGSKAEAWVAIEAFLREWRIRDYPPTGEPGHSQSEKV